jgi:hypothetical protein
MPESAQPITPADRDRAQSRLRMLTRGAIIAATGATVALGVVVAHDRPGSGAVKATVGTGTSSSTTTTSGSSDAGTTGTTGNTGTDSTTTTTTTTAPTRTSSSATVTSGATS